MVGSKISKWRVAICYCIIISWTIILCIHQDIILHSNELTKVWSDELTIMRERIAGLRVQLVQSLNQLQSQRDFSFIAKERGMFSFLGLSVEQVHKLKNDYSIYMTDTSRISVAGLTIEKMDYVSKAIVSVL